MDIKQMKTLGGLLCACLFPLGAWADDVAIVAGDLRITYVENGKQFNVEYKEGKAWRPVFVGSVPEASYDLDGKEGGVVSSASCALADYRTRKVADAFGRGTCHEFVFTSPANGDAVTLTQSFYVYDGKDYVLTDLALEGAASLRSNYLAPVAVSVAYDLYAPAQTNRMLRVPFDNDGFVRYHQNRMTGDMISYEVSALYAGESRRGVVLGSVSHDRWKSAVEVKASGDGRVEALKVFSGVANKETRDELPHGKVRGPEVRSALMFVGSFADWRDGMEEYARANTLVQPMRKTWTRGTPFGWQSWGVMSDKNSYDVDVAVSRYFKETLNPAGFRNSQGLNVMSIDAWDGMSSEQRTAFCKVVKENGQIPGSYVTPFCLWWNEDMLYRKIFEGSQYTGYECVLKVNGKPAKLDGAYCLDPTHPGTKEFISREVRNKKKEGFEYLKVDFTSNGMVQADSYYNKNVTTAVEAYNEGFSHFIAEVDKGEPMFIALSIAPIFPYQYGNSRRIACDTWGKIGQSEYSMNAVAGGWWTKEFYQYNDPDHLVLVGNDQEKETEGENRARFTNGAVSGMVLVSDNYSLEDRSGRGDAKLSRERAGKILTNADVNEMADLGRSGRPVYGYREHNGKADGAESCFVLESERYLYLAVLNYKDTPISGTVTLERLGLPASGFDAVKELWSGSEVEVGAGGLSYTVPGKDAKIFRFRKK